MEKPESKRTEIIPNMVQLNKDANKFVGAVFGRPRLSFIAKYFHIGLCPLAMEVNSFAMISLSKVTCILVKLSNPFFISREMISSIILLLSLH